MFFFFVGCGSRLQEPQSEFDLDLNVELDDQKNNVVISFSNIIDGYQIKYLALNRTVSANQIEFDSNAIICDVPLKSTCLDSVAGLSETTYYYSIFGFNDEEMSILMGTRAVDIIKQTVDNYQPAFQLKVDQDYQVVTVNFSPIPTHSDIFKLSVYRSDSASVPSLDSFTFICSDLEISNCVDPINILDNGNYYYYLYAFDSLNNERLITSASIFINRHNSFLYKPNFKLTFQPDQNKVKIEFDSPSPELDFHTLRIVRNKNNPLIHFESHKSVCANPLISPCYDSVSNLQAGDYFYSLFAFDHSSGSSFIASESITITAPTPSRTLSPPEWLYGTWYFSMDRYFEISSDRILYYHKNEVSDIELLSKSISDRESTSGLNYTLNNVRLTNNSNTLNYVISMSSEGFLNVTDSKFRSVPLYSQFVESDQCPDCLWHDEFSSKIYTNHWSFYEGYGSQDNGWGDNQWQFYSADNVFVEDGNLVIVAHQSGLTDVTGIRDGSITSAMISTIGKYTISPGSKLEARIKLPWGKGISPAFFAMGANAESVGVLNVGEIDVFQLRGGNPKLDPNNRTIYSSVFWYEGRNLIESNSLLFLNSLSDYYHIYSFIYNKDYIEIQIDGELVLKLQLDSDRKKELFNQPLFLTMRVAIGGDFAGIPNSSTIFPQKMYIDWIRVKPIN